MRKTWWRIPSSRWKQGELGAATRAFAPRDDAGAVGVSGQVDHAGQLGDFGSATQGAVLFQGRIARRTGSVTGCLTEVPATLEGECADTGFACGTAGSRRGPNICCLSVLPG